jgi:hypothetical protein
MTTLVIVGVIVLVIAVLSIQLGQANARMEGFREAQQRMNNGAYYAGLGAGNGCLEALMVLGLIALCALGVYLGSILF